MKFTKRQQGILKRAYGVKRFTSKFYNQIMNEDVTTLNQNLHKVGYKLAIKIVGKDVDIARSEWGIYS